MELSSILVVSWTLSNAGIWRGVGGWSMAQKVARLASLLLLLLLYYSRYRSLRRPLSLEFSDAKVQEPSERARHSVPARPVVCTRQVLGQWLQWWRVQLVPARPIVCTRYVLEPLRFPTFRRRDALPQKTTTGHYSKSQSATFHFVVLNECAVPHETQFIVLSPSDVLLQMSDPGTKFNGKTCF